MQFPLDLNKILSDYTMMLNSTKDNLSKSKEENYPSFLNPIVDRIKAIKEIINNSRNVNLQICFNRNIIDCTKSTLGIDRIFKNELKKIDELKFRIPTQTPKEQDDDVIMLDNDDVMIVGPPPTAGNGLPRNPVSRGRGRGKKIPISTMLLRPIVRKNNAVEKWTRWKNENMGNRIGYMIRHLSNSSTQYPLNSEDKNEILRTIEFLDFQSEPHHYFNCRDAITNSFKKLMSSKEMSSDKAKKIFHQLMHQYPLRYVIEEEIKTAVNPIMRYLAGLETLAPEEILSKILDFQNILRRWGFIESNQVFGSQSDALECFQILYDFLSEVERFQTKCEVMRRIVMDQDESKRTYTPANKDHMGKLIRECIIKKYPLTEEKLNEYLEKIGEKIGSTLNFKDLDGKDFEDVPTIEETLKDHFYNYKFPLFIPAYVDNGTLLRNGNLNSNLSRFLFADISSISAYGFHEGLVQKVQIPTLESHYAGIRGQTPDVLLFHPTTQFVSKSTIDIPAITVPAKISFEQQSYVLSKACVKTGNQNGGHYTFWTTNADGKGIYADSLKSEGFVISETSLSEQISGKTNIVLLEYQREDVDPKRYLIKQKLFQGQDHLCYLIQALYIIYGNSYFSSINQIEPYQSPLKDESDYVEVTPMESESVDTSNSKRKANTTLPNPTPSKKSRTSTPNSASQHQ